MLRARIIFTMRIIWLVCCLLLWGFWLASLPRFIDRSASGALPTMEINGLSPAELASSGAAAWGTSISTWAWINTAANGLSLLVFSLVALLIWWRVHTGFGLLTAYVLLVSGSAYMNTAIYSAQLSTTAIAAWEIGAIIWPLFFIWLYLFPNGQAVPRRLLWIFIPLVSLFAAFFLLATASIFTGGNSPLDQFVTQVEPLFEPTVIPLFLFVVGAQIYRYLRVSNAGEKKQTKWFLLGLLVAFVPLITLDIFADYPAEIDTLTFMALPIGIGISILRYRLFDIDVIIRKTLQYTLLTGLLALVYFGSVVLLQSSIGGITGEQSPAVIVVSTLAIVVLFNPLRFRIQDFIDRRFYRRKYNAERAVAQFSLVARDEVDINRLSAALLGVIDETVQASQISLWLKGTQGIKSPTSVR